MKSHPGVTGALVLGALTLVIIQVLSEQQALDFLTAILVAAASVYIGAALAGDNRSTLALETTAGLAFIAVALVGRWYASGILAWGYLAHGAWDILHHRKIAGANTGETYPVLCWVYDWIIAAVILVRF
jgi:hypothetical protein